jgi:hypothetical protein
VKYLALVLLIAGCNQQDFTSSVGPKGDSGVQGQNGADGQNGTNGQNGADGQNGTNGQNGADGQNGTNGQNGADAESIQVLQLCNGQPIYPSVFIEVAFKINNKLYAVYSIPGAFMTELTPGDYHSEAIGSRCNFTVNNDATITRSN